MTPPERPSSSLGDEISTAANGNYCTGSATGHEYDDDGAFVPADLRHLWPGSKPGDPCVWCLEDKP